MLDICPYCRAPVPSHGTCCRVPDDLDRFERVFERLAAGDQNLFLRQNLMRYLVAYGRRAVGGEPPARQPFLGSANSATSGAW